MVCKAIGLWLGFRASPDRLSSSAGGERLTSGSAQVQDKSAVSLGTGSWITPFGECSLISGGVFCCGIGEGTTSLMVSSKAEKSVLRRPVMVVYSHILSFFAQGPHIGLASSHFKCRLRHVMLQLSGQYKAHHTPRRQEALTIHLSSVGHGLGTFVCVAVYRSNVEASLRCHEIYAAGTVAIKNRVHFGSCNPTLSPSRGHV